jgi:alpha-L-rhamnosidase
VSFHAYLFDIESFFPAHAQIREEKEKRKKKEKPLLLYNLQSMKANNTSITSLKVEYRENPQGIDLLTPRFSWKMRTDRVGARQVAYQIVATGWDSGKVESDASHLIAWGGGALETRQVVQWKVTVWDETGAATTSDATHFEMGLLTRRDWQGAKWIGGSLVGGPRTSVPAPRLKKNFRLGEKKIVSARLYATALGVYEVKINGKRVGTDELTPAWTDYSKRVRYQTYDVSELLKNAGNEMTVDLGDGWYCGHIGWRDRAYYGDRPKFLGVLVVVFDDGTESVVRTDSSWKVAYGPRLKADLLMGEHYDARQDWGNWQSVQTFKESVILEAQNGPAVTITEEIKPIRAPYRHGDCWIFDMGQNMVGRVRLRVRGESGVNIRLRYAEVLEKGPLATDGGIYTTNLRAAENTDYYTLKGGTRYETWESVFTFHGFRYVEVRGLTEEPTKETILGLVLHSDTPTTGTFTCSDALVNQLQKNIDWGQRGNFLDVPTDCPQRDERLGWTGDAQVFARTAAFNRDVAGFFHKWMQDMRDSQGKQGEFPPVAPFISGLPTDGGAAWADAGVIVPWTVYLAYGDTQILRDNYAAMKRFVDFYLTTSRDYIRCYDGYDGWMGFGDWLALDGSGKTDGGTPKDLLGTAFMAYSLHLFSKIATLLGKKTDADKYETAFRQTKRVFIKKYVTPDGLIAPMTQTAGILALHFDLLPDDLRPAVTQWVIRDIKARGTKTSTGFAGSSYLPHALSDAGEWEVMSQLLFQKGWPSYLFAVTQGATTIWERWDGWTTEKGFQDPGMNSFNHYAYGAIGSWLYQRVAGLDTMQGTGGVGYKELLLRPYPLPGLDHAHATLETPYGTASSGWERDKETGKVTYTFTVPPNTTGKVRLPGSEKDIKVTAGTHTF